MIIRLKKYNLPDYLNYCILLFVLIITYDLLELYLNFYLPALKYFVSAVTFAFLIKIFFSKSSYSKIGILGICFITYTLFIIGFGLLEITNSAGNYLNAKLFFSGAAFFYIIPLISFLNIELRFLKGFFRTSFSLGYIYLICLIGFAPFLFVSKGDVESLGAVYASAVAFVFLTAHYHSYKVNFVSSIVLIIALVLNAILARRNQVVYFSAILALGMFYNLSTFRSILSKKKFNILIITILFIFASILLVSFNLEYFDLLIYRASTGMENRSDIIELFWNDITGNSLDLLFGRGMFGEFEGGILATNQDTGLRNTIENGYLQHILKGGLFYLALIIILCLRSIYLGFFKSNNLLSKASASIVLVYLIDMVGFGLPLLAIKYVVVWISIAICNSRFLRRLPDSVLSSHLSLK